MNSYSHELKEKKIVDYECKKMIEEFEKINGKQISSKFIDKYNFRTFLKDYEVNKIQHLSFEQRALTVKKFYKYFKVPFFDADFKNIENNTQHILQQTIPLILETEEIPKSNISKVISEKLDITINQYFSFKDKGEKALIKQIAFRAIFENFLPELRATPENALFVK
jgi:hypothetical protein